MTRPHYKALYLALLADEERLIADNEGAAARIKMYETTASVADKATRQIAEVLQGLMDMCYLYAKDNKPLMNICQSIDDWLINDEDIDWSGGDAHAL